jgi:hypothetical protein
MTEGSDYEQTVCYGYFTVVMSFYVHQMIVKHPYEPINGVNLWTTDAFLTMERKVLNEITRRVSV